MGIKLSKNDLPLPVDDPHQKQLASTLELDGKKVEPFLLIAQIKRTGPQCCDM